MGIVDRFRKAQRELVEGKLYSFAELTPQEQDDATMSLEGCANDVQREFGIETPSPDLMQYKLHLVQPDDISGNYVDSDSDPSSPEFQQFMESLKNGLENIPVGWEGRHRALAFKEMGMPMYWFEIIPPTEETQASYNPMWPE